MFDVAASESYEPMSVVGRVGVDLARVRTPEDAVAFTTLYGLLRHDKESDAKLATQPFADFEAAAEDLRKIFRTVVDVRKGASGDAGAIQRLREAHGPARLDERLTSSTADGRRSMTIREWLACSDASPIERSMIDELPRRLEPMTDLAVLTEASAWAAWGLSNGLLDTHPYVFDPAQLFPDAGHVPGTMRLGFLPENLLGFCYLSLAQQLSRRDEAIAECAECGRVFVVTHGRQEYCEPSCASRARWARHKLTPAYQRKAARKRQKQKGSKNGKATRTR